MKIDFLGPLVNIVCLLLVGLGWWMMDDDGKEDDHGHYMAWVSVLHSCNFHIWYTAVYLGKKEMQVRDRCLVIYNRLTWGQIPGVDVPWSKGSALTGKYITSPRSPPSLDPHIPSGCQFIVTLDKVYTWLQAQIDFWAHIQSPYYSSPPRNQQQAATMRHFTMLFAFLVSASLILAMPLPAVTKRHHQYRDSKKVPVLKSGNALITSRYNVVYKQDTPNWHLTLADKIRQGNDTNRGFVRILPNEKTNGSLYMWGTLNVFVMPEIAQGKDCRYVDQF